MFISISLDLENTKHFVRRSRYEKFPLCGFVVRLDSRMCDTVLKKRKTVERLLKML